MERHERRELSLELLRLAEPYRKGTDMRTALVKAAAQLVESEKEMDAAFLLKHRTNFFERNGLLTWTGKEIAVMLTPTWGL